MQNVGNEDRLRITLAGAPGSMAIDSFSVRLGKAAPSYKSHPVLSVEEQYRRSFGCHCLADGIQRGVEDLLQIASAIQTVGQSVKSARYLASIFDGHGLPQVRDPLKRLTRSLVPFGFRLFPNR
jgi:hypothetical protein